MALTLGDNFSYQGAKPLDARLKYDTVAAMKAVADATMYEGCLAYCSGTDKTYQWKSGNTVDETLGKWREFNSGGGGGGATYTAGDGIDISEENVISTEKSQSGWMDEVIEKVPMAGPLVNIANAFNRSDLYSTDEKMIGQWIDGKPLYQKTVNFGSLSNKDDKVIDHGIANIDRIVHAHALAFNPTTGSGKPLSYAYDNGGSGLAAQIAFNVSRTYIEIFNRGDNYSAFDAYATIQYTKTTDSAIAIGSENEYSTDEKIVGSWIDGRPVYQKTMYIDTLVNNEVASVPHNISNLDIVVKINGIFWYSGGKFAPMPNMHMKYPSNNAGLDITKTHVNIDNRNGGTVAEHHVYVTFEYVKTASS